ncbi:hypothetical protein FACS189419_02300 [Planctomycetales bacterium]|nr:hypothetical protein FACS189419_02300 [Planctomycetales bacterium]
MDELEEQKLDALAEFAAGAGHEINNPLSIINGRAQLLLREIKEPSHRQQLEIILAQTRRAYEMIADIRFFARPPKPEIERFDLRKELDKIVSEQMPLMKADGIALHYDFQFRPKENSIESDPVLLHTAVSLLCLNARESLLLANRQGNVYLSAQCKNSSNSSAYRTVSVEDDGAGVPDEWVSRIFDPYFSGRQAGRGLGFGLPKVWRIMQILGGTVSFEKPSRFVLELLATAQEIKHKSGT